MDDTVTRHYGAALVCLLAGAFPLAIALNLVDIEPSKVHAPLWVVGAAGASFWIACCMLLLATSSRINDALGALLLSFFGCIAAWVALYGDAQSFGGGSIMLSKSANVGLARWMFGGSSVICFVFAAYAMRRALRCESKVPDST